MTYEMLGTMFSLGLAIAAVVSAVAWREHSVLMAYVQGGDAYRRENPLSRRRLNKLHRILNLPEINLSDPSTFTQ